MSKKVQNAIFPEKKEKHSVSTLHFFGMSISSVLSTCIYLYYIMDLCVKLYFREHPLVETYGIVRSGDDGEIRNRILLSV
jgi:hypothetical protein